jgi:glutathione S-transferase
MFRRKRTVHFVYAERFKHSGSTVMRGGQLCGIAGEALGDSANVSYTPLDATMRNATLFLTKGALMTATPERLQELKSAGNRLLFDVVDEVPPPTTRGYADLIVAASITGFVDLQRDHPSIEVVLVNHHVDPRLAGLPASRPQDRLRAGYFGELVNAVLTPAIEQLVTPVLVDTSSQSDGWLARLPEFNLHYAVRLTRGADHHKPFLKGFTAAHSGSNILIQRSQGEAVLWLGEDYPYLLDDEPTPADILTALNRLRDDFGSPEWMRGLDVMRDIRARTLEARIGAEVARALS